MSWLVFSSTSHGTYGAIAGSAPWASTVRCFAASSRTAAAAESGLVPYQSRRKPMPMLKPLTEATALMRWSVMVAFTA
jgi:hypothetical protein